MIFLLGFMLLFFGLFLAGLPGLLPYAEQWIIPDMFRIFFFIIGLILSFFGMMIIHGRAMKTGAIHLLEFGRPNKILWFYVHKDGTITITPAMREVEGQLYSPELDAQIHEMKSYRLFDHSVRIVPEGMGHAVDLGMCLYAKFLKTRYGFENLREARYQTRMQKLLPFLKNKGKEIEGAESVEGEF